MIYHRKAPELLQLIQCSSSLNQTTGANNIPQVLHLGHSLPSRHAHAAGYREAKGPSCVTRLWVVQSQIRCESVIQSTGGGERWECREGSRRRLTWRVRKLICRRGKV